MASYTQNSKRNRRIADQQVGYSYLEVSDTVQDLSDAVDDADVKVDIPDSATGAVIRVEMITTGTELRVSSSETVPDIADKRGVVVYEGDTIITLGRVQGSDSDPFELQNFKAVCNTGKTAKLHIVYYKSPL